MNDTQRNRLIATTCASMAQHGVIMLLAGALLPSMMKTFAIREGSAGILLGFGSLGFVIGPFLAGLLADRKGTRAVFLVGFGSEVLLLAAVGLAPSFVAIVAAFFLLNIAAGFIETPVNIVPTLIGGVKTSSLMSLVHMFFSIGAFISPFLAGLLLQATGGWRPVWLLAILPTALLFATVVRQRFPGAPAHVSIVEHRPTKLFTILRERPIFFGAIAMMLYVAAEFGASNWITLYLQQELGFQTLAATSGLSILWLGLLIGRFLNSRLALHRASGELVLWSGIAGLATGLLLLTARTPILAYIWLFGLGLAMAGVFPNIMADLNGRNPARTGLITGFLAQSAAFGSLIAQPTLGVVAERVNLPIALSIVAFLMGLVAVVTYLGAGNLRALRHQPVTSEP